VLQLIVLASFARTVRMQTVYAALGAGLFLCAPATVALQLALTKIFALSMGMSVPEVVRIAGYTLDPFIEEFAKVLPLFLLLLVPLYRRQWSFTDLVLIGAATGSGFGLAEDLYRFGGSADHAQSMAGGWALVFSNDYLLVPGIGHIVTSWLPHGVAAHDTARLNEHLIWSSVAGLAVGLVVLARTTAARFTALGLFVCISLDHAAGNMSDVGDSWLAYLAWPLRALVHVRPLMPLAALGAAWWLDQKRYVTGVAIEPLLEAERSGTSRLRGILDAAFIRLPWSLIAVDRFARMRRAARTDHLTTQTVPLHALVVNERDRVDIQLAKWRTTPPPLWPAGWSGPALRAALRAALRRPPVVLWLVIMTPPVLYFVIGGWPQTAGLQAFMIHPLVAKMLFPISVLAQAWILWRTIVGLRVRSRNAGASIGDEAALVGLRAACGIGAVSLGAFSLLRMLGGVAPGSSILASLHAQSAANRLTPGSGSMLADGAGALAPPPPATPDPATPDASTPDPATPDAGAPDAGAPDAGAPDAGAPDAATPDAATPDAATPDAATPEPATAEPPTPPPATADPATVEPLTPEPPTPDPATVEPLTPEPPTPDPATVEPLTPEPPTPDPKTPDPPVQESSSDSDSSPSPSKNDAPPPTPKMPDELPAERDGVDPLSVADAQERVSAAHRAADSADIAAADDFNDPWGEKSPARAAADDARDAARDAEAQRDQAVNAAQQKLNADAEAAAQAQAAQEAAAQRAIDQQRAADPEGAALDDANKAAADAQQRADKAFLDSHDPDGANYHDAIEAARQKADAAKTARETYAARKSPDGWKPDKP
jgi:hypothetical protein